jgi:hypothetical protein
MSEQGAGLGLEQTASLPGRLPFLAGIACPAWGACVTGPIYRGLCATSPKRLRRQGPLLAATCRAVNVASITSRPAGLDGWLGI